MRYDGVCTGLLLLLNLMAVGRNSGMMMGGYYNKSKLDNILLLLFNDINFSICRTVPLLRNLSNSFFNFIFSLKLNFTFFVICSNSAGIVLISVKKLDKD